MKNFRTNLILCPTMLGNLKDKSSNLKNILNAMNDIYSNLALNYELINKVINKIKNCDDKANDLFLNKSWKEHFNLINIANSSSIEETFNSIKKEIKNSILSVKQKSKTRFIVLGGDHSVTYGIIDGIKESIEIKDMLFVIFDAHPDVESDFFITHEDYLRCLINNKILSTEQILLIGIRNMSFQELKFLEENNISYITSFDFKDLISQKTFQRDYEDKINGILKKLNNFKRIYMSIDNDVFDFSFASTYYEPMGITLYEFIKFYLNFLFEKNLVGFDIVEYTSFYDFHQINAKSLAHLLWILYSLNAMKEYR